MTCFVSLGWWALHPRAAICIVWQYTACRHMHVYKHLHTQIAFRKLHHFPAVVWKLHLSPTVAPIIPWVSFISLLLPSLSLWFYLTILSFTFHFSRGRKLPGLDCPYEQRGVDRASRRCVRMHQLLRYHQLFSFSSPSDAVRSQTRYHSAPTANPPSCQEVGKENGIKE